MTNENHNVSTTRVAMATNLDRMVPHLDGQSIMVDNVVLRSNVTNKNHYISTTTVPMATKLG